MHQQVLAGDFTHTPRGTSQLRHGADGAGTSCYELNEKELLLLPVLCIMREIKMFA